MDRHTSTYDWSVTLAHASVVIGWTAGQLDTSRRQAEAIRILLVIPCNSFLCVVLLCAHAFEAFREHIT
jgi:hypothetical protein